MKIPKMVFLILLSPFLCPLLGDEVALENLAVRWDKESVPEYLEKPLQEIPFPTEGLLNFIAERLSGKDPESPEYVAYLRLAYNKAALTKEKTSVIWENIFVRKSKTGKSILELFNKNPKTYEEKFIVAYSYFLDGEYRETIRNLPQKKGDLPINDTLSILCDYLYALALYESGDTLGGEKKLLSLYKPARISPIYGNILVSLGIISLRKGDYQKAIEYAVSAESLFLKNGVRYAWVDDALYIQGFAFYMLQQIDSLYNICFKKIWGSPCSSRRISLVYTYLLQRFLSGDTSQVVTMLDSASCDNGGKLSFLRGYIAYRMGRYERSMNELFLALNETSDDSRKEALYLFLGESAYELKRYKVAEEFYNACIKFQGEYKKTATYGLAWTLFREGKIKDAVDLLRPLYKSASATDTFALSAWYSVGTMFRRNAQYEDAIKEFDALLRVSKIPSITNPAKKSFFECLKKLDNLARAGDYAAGLASKFGKEALLAAIQFYYNGRLWDRVIATADKLLTRDDLKEEERGELELRKSLAHMHNSPKEWTADKFIRLGEKYPTAPGIENYMFEAAEIFDSLGKTHEEILVLDWLISFPLPDSIWGEALYKKCVAALKEGDKDGARSAALKLANELANHPRVPETLYLVAQAYAKANKDSLSLQYFQKVALNYPSSPFAFHSSFAIGEIFFKRRKYEESREFFRFVRLKSSLRELKEKALIRELESYFYEGNAQDGIRLAKTYVDSVKGATRGGVYSLLGDMYYSLSESDSATKYYSLATTENIPANFRASIELRLGELLVYSGDYNTAESLFNKVIQESDDDSIIARARENIRKIKKK